MTDQSLSKQFESAFRILASQCGNGEQIEPWRYQLYLRVFKQAGFDVGLAGIQKELLNRDSRAPMPSPRKLLSLGLSVTEQDETCPQAIADRMVGAVAKFGHTNLEEAKAYIGPIGWRVIQRQGGWRTVCETMQADKVGVYRSQWQKSVFSELDKFAEELVNRAISGSIAEKKALDPASSAKKELDGLVKMITDKKKTED